MGVGAESEYGMMALYMPLERWANRFITSSGGFGSNGANGAPGGSVFVTVHDDDTDLLLPLEYNTKGGDGGASGLHGEPGDGGRGGRGGQGYAWADGDTARVMAGGRNGNSGPPGNRPSTYLSAGSS